MEPSTKRTSDKRTVTLEIAGAKYRFVADADEGRLQQLADMVNERVAGLSERPSRAASPAQLLAIAALSLADDLLIAQRRLRQIDGLTRTALGDAIARIDRRLEQDAQNG